MQALWLGGDGGCGGAVPERCVVAVRAGFRVLWWLTLAERCSFLPVVWGGHQRGAVGEGCEVRSSV